MVKALRLGPWFKTAIRKSASSNLVQIICLSFYKKVSTHGMSDGDGMTSQSLRRARWRAQEMLSYLDGWRVIGWGVVW